MDNMDPRIRRGEGQERIDNNAPGNVGSFKGKPLAFDPGLQKPKASTWGSMIDLISTPLHMPYAKLSAQSLIANCHSVTYFKEKANTSPLNANP